MRLAWAFLAFAVSWPAIGQQVFRCEVDGATVFQNAPCEKDSQPHQLQQDNSFGGSKRSHEVGLEGNLCLFGVAYTKATGYLVNRTGERKDVEMIVTFTRRGAVLETGRRTVSVRPWGREPFEVYGPRSQADCEWNWRW